MKRQPHNEKKYLQIMCSIRDFQNIQTAHTAQYQKTTQSKKWVKYLNKAFLQRRHKDG